jgi:queuine tRNA-ribosyltransferase
MQELDEKRPRHLLGIGEIDDLVRGVALGIDTFDCAMPTRLARHGMALVPDPARRWRADLTKSAARDSREPVLPGCRCEACAGGYSRAYLSHLIRARELTGMRLLTLHNLKFVADLMGDLRAALLEERFADAAVALRAGAAPGQG